MVDIHQRYHVLGESERDQALKVFLVEDTWQARKRLLLKWIPTAYLAESELLQLRYKFAAFVQLKHPYLAAFYDFGFIPESQACFYTMENVEGESLHDYAARQRAATPDDFTWLYGIAAQLAQVLDYIHARGLLHLAVHPQRIRITPRGQVKLMDFALVGESQGPVAWRWPGPPLYLAPEVIQGEALDVRADLYALGCTLYECITGKSPLRAGWSITSGMRHGLEPSLDDLPAAVPEELRHLLQTLLAREQGRRPRDDQAVLQALNASNGAEAPHKAPDTGWIYFQLCDGRARSGTGPSGHLADSGAIPAAADHRIGGGG